MSLMSWWAPVSKEAVHTHLWKFKLRTKRIPSDLLGSKRYFKDRELDHRSQNTLLETQNYF